MCRNIKLLVGFTNFLHFRDAGSKLEVFTKKDPPVLTMDEMRSSVQAIDELDANAKDATKTLMEINQEETFLGKINMPKK